MKPKFIWIPYAFVFLLPFILIGFMYERYSNHSSLTIRFNGKPYANVEFKDQMTGEIFKTDSSGKLTHKSGTYANKSILMPLKEGGATYLSFPVRGHKTIDFYKDYTNTETVFYRFGLFRISESVENYAFTPEDMESIKGGKSTVQQVQASIKQEAEKTL